MNIPVRVTLVFLTVFTAAFANAQDVTYPGKPRLKEHASTKYRVTVGFPAHWSLKPPPRNEIWFSVGEIRSNNAACFVRVSEVEHLHLLTPETFFAQMDEKAFIKLNSIGMPDIKVHLYDPAYLNGRKARRVAYSGTDSGIKTGTITYQALDGDRIFTVGCLSEASAFQLLFNDFEAVISSFRFLK
jgi:hypothetical protein